MIWNTVELLNSLAEMGIICVYFNKLMKNKYSSKYCKFIGFTIFALITCFFSMAGLPPPVLLILSFAIFLAPAVIFYDEKMIYKVFYTVLYIIIILIADPILVGISCISENITYTLLFENSVSRVIGMLITKILYFWMSTALARVLTGKVKELPFKYWLSILLVPVFSIVILYGMTVPIIEHAGSSIIAVYILSMIGIIYINIAAFNLFDGYSKQIKLAFMEAVAEREADNYRAFKISYKEMQKLKHDFKNELDTLNHLISERKYDAAEKHIEEISDFITKSSAVCYTGNEAVDSLINIKIKTAEMCGIKVITKMKIEALRTDVSMELCRILANALDNAIEACGAVKDKKKFICISIKEIDENVLIEISNLSNAVDTSNLISTKTKNGLHGFGVESICSSADSLGGTVHFKYENGVFTFKLLMINKLCQTDKS